MRACGARCLSKCACAPPQAEVARAREEEERVRQANEQKLKEGMLAIEVRAGHARPRPSRRSACESGAEQMERLRLDKERQEIEVGAAVRTAPAPAAFISCCMATIAKKMRW